MLFVFQVDTGHMMTFDMSFTLQSVQDLKAHVERESKIPASKQVLLISGGDHLESDARVCSYPAGTDTNPFFLFSKAILESATAPLASFDSEEYDYDLTGKFKECSDLPPSYNTVIKRTQLAQQFYEIGQEQTKICERLVHEQHLQNQGWMAVIANLDDLKGNLKARYDLYKNMYQDYMADRDSYLDSIKHFKDDIQILQRIPILSTLLKSESKIKVVPETSEELDITEEINNHHNEISLLEWITKRENFLDNLYEYCTHGLMQFDEKLFIKMCSGIEETLKYADCQNMKTISGLGDRLFGLESLLQQSKSIVKEQMDLAQSFVKNKNRATNLKEPSILPDLCVSHLQQLQILFKNHTQVRDITRRIYNAKNELCENLYERLRWVVFMEKRLCDVDSDLVYSVRNLVNLRKHLELLQQMHMAPVTYLSAVTEVVRRRTFSQSYLLWASELACHLLTIHNEELARRKDFQSMFEGHFLKALFPGMNDLPPTFATEAPSLFDSKLPKVLEDDIERLKMELPELSEHLTIPDNTTIMNFFMLHSIKDDDKKNVNDKLMQVVNDLGLASNLDRNLLKAIENDGQLEQEQPLNCSNILPGLVYLRDLDKGCESETDTEEFEKVSQNPFELTVGSTSITTKTNNTVVTTVSTATTLISPLPPQSSVHMQDAATLTEVGEKCPLQPPKKPPRTFQKSLLPSQQLQQQEELQHMLSISGSNTESFTNIKNPSLESIDELSSLKNFISNTESCFNSHYQQVLGKSKSPLTPQSPIQIMATSPVISHNNNIDILGHQQQPQNDFVNDEFYIDESLPSSLSIETTGQSQGEFVKQLDTANNVVALLQDNLEITRSEHEKVKTQCIKMKYLVDETLNQLKNELSEFKNEVVNEKSVMEQQHVNLNNSWDNLILEKENHEREIIQRLTVDHELEISDFRKIAQNKNEEIKLLKESNVNYEVQLKSIIDENLELKKRLDEAYKESETYKKKLEREQIEHDKNIKETVDRLKCEHRGEIESIRSRFKLMTMERSPSENSLEKIESSLVNETILLQMRDNFEAEKEIAINEAIAKENDRWQSFYDESILKLQCSLSLEKDALIADMTKQFNENKDKQIEVLKEQIKNLQLECAKHKNIIQQITESYSDNSELLEKIDLLKNEKEVLESQIEKFKKEKSSDSSESSSEGKCSASTNSIKLKRVESLSEKMTKISIDSCKNGDYVLIIWEPMYQNFRILQCGYSLFFVHFECLKQLELTICNGKPNKLYCVAEVVKRECCQARKPVNRFNVPKGTRFFRVRVKSVNGIELFQQSEIPSTKTKHSKSQQLSKHFSDILVTGNDSTTNSLPSSPTRTQSLNWEQPTTSISLTTTELELSLPTIHQLSIPEEKGVDDVTTDSLIEKGKEVTENFTNEDNDNKNIDRSQVCVIS